MLTSFLPRVSIFKVKTIGIPVFLRVSRPVSFHPLLSRHGLIVLSLSRIVIRGWQHGFLPNTFARHQYLITDGKGTFVHVS